MSCLIKYNYQYVYIDSESKMKLGSKVRAKVFDDQKAKNLIKNPPKNMRLYKFEIEPLIEGKTECEIKQEQILQRAAEHAKKTGCYTELKENLIVEAKPEVKQEVKIENKSTTKEEDHNNNIDNWLKKLHSCNGIKEEARERMEYLYKKLSLIDQAQDVFLHVIESNEHPNASMAYKERMKLSEIRKKRRQIKNELAVVQMIISNNTSSKLYERMVAVSESIQNPQNINIKYTNELTDDLISQFERM
ncbi:hypothetical protein DW904_21795 [Ruminococcus sp. AM42-11]|uniref:hypothetical protein n=1 Tax=Ruminococcus sp. AM42-11 TaxID=2292372 RepID=UPI000E50A0DC|nr:hypothetical protein [Ruminococcus sp. AM42-11]RHS92853.1 hypothetical protein DW904_21795 [Ruminococcus sp. AM42-11]